MILRGVAAWISETTTAHARGHDGLYDGTYRNNARSFRLVLEDTPYEDLPRTSHENCNRRNVVLLVAASATSARWYARATLPIGIQHQYVSSRIDILGRCHEHVPYVVVPGAYRHLRFDEIISMLLDRGFKEGLTP